MLDLVFDARQGEQSNHLDLARSLLQKNGPEAGLGALRSDVGCLDCSTIAKLSCSADVALYSLVASYCRDRLALFQKGQVPRLWPLAYI